MSDIIKTSIAAVALIALVSAAACSGPRCQDNPQFYLRGTAYDCQR